jgi:hypothetical protein
MSSGPRCTLRLRERVVLVASDGTPEAEYALFDPSEIELRATEPSTIREAGYRTTVERARARLAALGLTPAVAAQAAEAAKAGGARAYARGAAVRCILGQLGAEELFDGATYDARTGRYAGAWLDLPLLASDLPIASAHGLLQALHLAALLAEQSDDAPVALDTLEVSALRRPGERTFRRVTFEDVGALVDVLHDLKPSSPKHADAGPSRLEVLERLREQAVAGKATRARLAAVEELLATPETPKSGPLADPEAWNVELALSRGDTVAASAVLDAIEQRRGRLPATAYLRARLALMTGAEDPRAIAERVAALSTSMPSFHELELLAAEAWAAAGDPRRATAFARDLLENATVSDSIRMRGQDIVATGGGRPPSSSVLTPRRASTLPPLPSSSPSIHFRVESRPDRGGGSLHPVSGDAEKVETLGLPPGTPADTGVVLHDPPRSPREARVACTLLARDLARELRARHGVELRCDVEGLEIAQRYLIEDQAPSADQAVGTATAAAAAPGQEMRPYGAFLSELLARRLGARWAALPSGDASGWAMLVPSASRPDEVLRIWPFARIARFVAMGHKERDLVSYYLELEARAR